MASHEASHPIARNIVTYFDMAITTSLTLMNVLFLGAILCAGDPVRKSFAKGDLDERIETGGGVDQIVRDLAEENVDSKLEQRILVLENTVMNLSKYMKLLEYKS